MTKIVIKFVLRDILIFLKEKKTLLTISYLYKVVFVACLNIFAEKVFGVVHKLEILIYLFFVVV
jgi:hypothetical protein